MNHDAVRATVECHERFVQPGLWRHHRDLTGWHIRRVDDEHSHPASKPRRQSIVQITLVDRSPDGGEISPSALHRGRLDVSGMQFDLAVRAQPGGYRDADGTRTAAQVHDQPRTVRKSRLTRCRDRLADQELAAAPRNEDAGPDGDAQAAKFSPADNVLERQPGHTALHHVLELISRRRCCDEQISLILGKDAACRPEPADNRGPQLLAHQGNEVLVKWVSVSMSLIL
jgi:hypothetical protein